ncbi:MAG: beta-ketoacyl-[acyl-carrier-protein] synthase family protein [Pirellulales bacterium]|nr:beta-ketoacyl-[acyl-carrier-protein] synthase family protein [Pirellulales bacterium]
MRCLPRIGPKHAPRSNRRLPTRREVVITGVGVVSPIGNGCDAFWASLLGGRSGVRPITRFDTSATAAHFGGEISDFDPKQFIAQRKSLKVMSHDIQLGVAAASLAQQHAALDTAKLTPERLGVVFGADLMHCELAEAAPAFAQCLVDGQFDFSRWGTAALEKIYPLWMLKYLPNMPACHVAIACDARGPSNSITMGDVSSLCAVAEAASVVERDEADVMFCGGASSRIHPTLWVRSSLTPWSRRNDDPQGACRPFDAHRDGAVNGEGAAVFVVESREHAEARRAKILATVAGSAMRFEPRRGQTPREGVAIRHAIEGAMRSAGVEQQDIGHINAHGLSTAEDDCLEARAIAAVLPDTPVTAPKSYFGNLGAGSGAVELAASVLAMAAGEVPATLNYEQPDPACPLNVIHRRTMKTDAPAALVLNHAATGQAAALVLRRPS